MKTIWKFPLITEVQSVDMPHGAKVLSAQVQDKQICVWALVDPSKATTSRHFEVFGTGHDIPTDMGVDRKFISTIQAGALVWHVFERIN